MKLLKITLMAFAFALVPASLLAQSPQKTVPEEAHKGILQSLNNYEVKSLRKLDGVYVVPDAIDKALADLKFNGSDLRRRVEDLLRRHGVKVLDETSYKNTIGRPFLKIKVNIDPQSIQNKPFRGLVKVALTQGAFLMQDKAQHQKATSPNTDSTWLFNTSDGLYVESWHNQESFNENDFEGIRKLVDTIVLRFIDDFKAAKKLNAK